MPLSSEPAPVILGNTYRQPALQGIDPALHRGDRRLEIIIVYSGEVFARRLFLETLTRLVIG
jgi:hypothetical protein